MSPTQRKATFALIARLKAELATADAVARHYKEKEIRRLEKKLAKDRPQQNPRPSEIPASVRDLAIKHRINLGRDGNGHFFITDPTTGKVAARYMSVEPTVAGARAIIRKWLRDHQSREQPTGRYAPDLSRVCGCGHSMGDHLAEGRISERSCTVAGCGCQGFKGGNVRRARNPVDQGTPWQAYTLSQMKQANADAGFHWFKPFNMRHANSKLYKGAVYPAPQLGRTYFVSSEQDNYSDQPRRFSVRVFDWHTGRVSNVSEYGAYATLGEAKAAARFQVGGRGKNPSRRTAPMRVKLMRLWEQSGKRVPFEKFYADAMAARRGSRKLGRGRNPGVRQTYGPAHHYKGYGVAALVGPQRLLAYMVEPYDKWGRHKDAISFALQSSAEFAAKKSGRRCAVVPLAQNRDIEVANLLRGKE